MGKGIAEKEISLWDMFWAICLKWRRILVCALIFMILFGGLSYYDSNNTIKSQETAKKVTLAELENNMTYDEVKTAKLFLEFKEIYDEMSYYNENAPFMQLDADSFYVGEVGVFLDNHYVVEYPVIAANNNVVAMINEYRTVLGESEFAEKLKEIIGSHCDADYALELVDCSGEYDGANSIEKDDASGVFSVLVYADTEEKCKEIMILVKEHILNQKPNVVEKYGNHDITIFRENVSLGSSVYLLNEQKNNIEIANICSNYMINLKPKFSDAQTAYIAKAYEGQAEDASLSDKGEQIEPTPSVSSMWVIMGFVLGALVAFVYYAVRYMLYGKLRIEDDFETIFGSRLLGVIPISEKEKRWFGFVDRLFEKNRHMNQRYFKMEDALDMLAANIRVEMKKREGKKIVISGNASIEDKELLVKGLLSYMVDVENDFLCCDSVLYDAKALEKMAEIEKVIFVERAEEAFCKEIEKEIRICAEKNIDLLGCVVVY